MARWSIIGLMAAISLACDRSAVVAGDAAPRWVNDYGEARALARAAGKPIFLVFR